MFVEHARGVIYSRAMVLFPDIFDNTRLLSLDKRHFHDLSEFAGTGVGEGHSEANFLNHL